MLWLDKLKGYREIGAYLMMGVLALSILQGLLRLVGSDDYDPGFATRAYMASGSFLSAAAAIVLALLVLSLATQAPKSPRVGMLALIGAIVAGVGVVCSFLFGLIGIGADIFEAVGRFQYILNWLSQLIVPGIVTFVLLMIYLGTKPAPAYQHPQQYGQQAPGQMPGQSPFPGVGQPQQYGAGQQPTWQPDQASGGAWQTAGQAASGASATEWGQPGQQGWGQPSATEPPAPQEPQQQAWAPQSATEPPAQQGWGQPSATEPPAQQGWGQPSATEPPAQQGWSQPSATEPPAQQGWQPVDPQQPGGPQQGGYQQ